MNRESQKLSKQVDELYRSKRGQYVDELKGNSKAAMMIDNLAGMVKIEEIKSSEMIDVYRLHVDFDRWKEITDSLTPVEFKKARFAFLANAELNKHVIAEEMKFSVDEYLTDAEVEKMKQAAKELYAYLFMCEPNTQMLMGVKRYEDGSIQEFDLEIEYPVIVKSVNSNETNAIQKFADQFNGIVSIQFKTSFEIGKKARSLSSLGSLLGGIKILINCECKKEREFFEMNSAKSIIEFTERADGEEETVFQRAASEIDEDEDDDDE